MNLLDALPLLQGWSFIRINEEKDVGAGKDITLYESPDNEKGWFLGATVGSNIADVGLRIEYNTAETGQTITYELKPSDLYTAHRISPNGLGPYVAVYDDVNDIYEAVFAPSVPFPFDGTLAVNAIAGANDATVYVDVQFIVITDEATFVNGLRRLIGVTNIEGYLYNALQQLSQLGRRPIEVRLPELPIPPVPQTVGRKYTGFLP